MYPPEIVAPMIAELESVGFESLHSVESVDEAIKHPGTTLVVVNSVCGCAARNARPAVVLSLKNAKKPDHLVTVFAGFDIEATAQMRDYMLPFPPSSPSVLSQKLHLLPARKHRRLTLLNALAASLCHKKKWSCLFHF